MATGDVEDGNNAHSIKKAAEIVSNWRSKPPQLLKLSNGGDHVFSLDEQGNFVIESQLIESATANQLAPAGSDLWIVKDDLGAVVARVDSVGDMFLKGSIDEGLACPLTPSDEILILRNPSDEVVAFLDGGGNLKLTGAALIWKNGSP